MHTASSDDDLPNQICLHLISIVKEKSMIGACGAAQVFEHRHTNRTIVYRFMIMCSVGFGALTSTDDTLKHLHAIG